MSRFGSLKNPSYFNSFPTSVPSNISALRNRAFSPSGNVYQVFPGSFSRIRKPTGTFGNVFEGISLKEKTDIYHRVKERREAFKKWKEAKKQQEEASKVGFWSRFWAWDKKMQQSIKDSFVATSLLGLGVMVGGRSLYDKYVAHKDIQPNFENKGVETRIPERVMPEMPKKQQESLHDESSWTSLKDMVASKWSSWIQ